MRSISTRILLAIAQERFKFLSLDIFGMEGNSVPNAKGVPSFSRGCIVISYNYHRVGRLYK